MTSLGDEDQVMAALNLSEGVAKKFDLILAKLCSLDSKMKDLNTTVKSLQRKLSVIEIDVDSLKEKQKNLDEKFANIEFQRIHRLVKPKNAERLLDVSWDSRTESEYSIKGANLKALIKGCSKTFQRNYIQREGTGGKTDGGKERR